MASADVLTRIMEPKMADIAPNSKKRKTIPEEKNVQLQHSVKSSMPRTVSLLTPLEVFKVDDDWIFANKMLPTDWPQLIELGPFIEESIGKMKGSISIIRRPETMKNPGMSPSTFNLFLEGVSPNFPLVPKEWKSQTPGKKSNLSLAFQVLFAGSAQHLETLYEAKHEYIMSLLKKHPTAGDLVGRQGLTLKKFITLGKENKSAQKTPSDPKVFFPSSIYYSFKTNRYDRHSFDYSLYYQGEEVDTNMTMDKMSDIPEGTPAFSKAREHLRIKEFVFSPAFRDYKCNLGVCGEKIVVESAILKCNEVVVAINLPTSFERRTTKLPGCM